MAHVNVLLKTNLLLLPVSTVSLDLQRDTERGTIDMLVLAYPSQCDPSAVKTLYPLRGPTILALLVVALLFVLEGLPRILCTSLYMFLLTVLLKTSQISYLLGFVLSLPSFLAALCLL